MNVKESIERLIEKGEIKMSFYLRWMIEKLREPENKAIVKAAEFELDRRDAEGNHFYE